MKHLPVIYQHEIPESLVDLAVQEFSLLPSQEAAMGMQAESKDPQGRNTTLRFPAVDHWFGGVLAEAAYHANHRCEWRFKTDSHEAVQFAEYGPSQHYAWHSDTFTLVDTEYDRKMTVICQMNHPHEYEGGELEFRFRNEFMPQLKKGSIVVFPSFIEHRVRPVTRGTRFSSVLWVSGPRMR